MAPPTSSMLSPVNTGQLPVAIAMGELQTATANDDDAAARLAMANDDDAAATSATAGGVSAT